jgi:hypothetical protein
LFGSSRAEGRLSLYSSRPPRLIPQGFKACTLIAGFVLLASCGGYDRAYQARAAEINKLQHETFAQAAEGNRCANVSCAGQEAGFAYAKKNNMSNPDGCLGKGDEDFVEGCRQYGENIEQAYQRIAAEG